MESHLLQMRGLKLYQPYKHSCSYKSHLLQMRGLKQFKDQTNIFGQASHLLQMRGLKHKEVLKHIGEISRIFYRCVD